MKSVCREELHSLGSTGPASAHRCRHRCTPAPESQAGRVAGCSDQTNSLLEGKHAGAGAASRAALAVVVTCWFRQTLFSTSISVGVEGTHLNLKHHRPQLTRQQELASVGREGDPIHDVSQRWPVLI